MGVRIHSSSVVSDKAEIGDGTQIWLNCQVREGAKIGKNCLIGANSLITENKIIPDGAMVMGAPGKIVRELTEQQIAGMQLGSHHYVENWKRYAKGLKRIG